MKVENGKYIEMTERELIDIYLRENWDDCYSFIEFKLAMQRCGCKIIEIENSIQN